MSSQVQRNFLRWLQCSRDFGQQRLGPFIARCDEFETLRIERGIDALLGVHRSILWQSNTTIQSWGVGFHATRFSTLSDRIHDATTNIDELCEGVSSRQIKVTISQPTEYPERRLPYTVRWRVNGRRYWRSFATKQVNNGAGTFYSLLKVAAMNERDWSSETGLPSSLNSIGGMNVAQYCRLYIPDEWRRLSPSTRKSYVEGLKSLERTKRSPSISAPKKTRATTMKANAVP